MTIDEQTYQPTWNRAEDPDAQQARTNALAAAIKSGAWTALGTFEEIIAEGRRLRLMGLGTPVALGGHGLDTRHIAQLFRAFERLDTASSHSIGYQNTLAVYPLLFAGMMQSDGPLARIARGDALGTFVLTEPQGGSNMRGMTEMAQRIPGGWVVRGVKSYIAHAEVADCFVLNARTASGFKAFVIDRNQPGIRITKRFDIAYMRRIYVNELEFDGLTVSDENVIDDEKVVYDTMMITRVLILAGKIGHIERCLDHLGPWIESRVISTGLMKDNPSVRRRVRNLEMGARVLEHLMEYAIRCEEAGGAPYDLAVAAKVAGVDVAFEASHTLQYGFGARGLDHGTGIPLVCDDVRTWALMEGASEPLQHFLAVNYLHGHPWMRDVVTQHPDLFADIPRDRTLVSRTNDLPSLGGAVAWALVAASSRAVGQFGDEERWYAMRRIARYLQDFNGLRGDPMRPGLESASLAGGAS